MHSTYSALLQSLGDAPCAAGQDFLSSDGRLTRNAGQVLDAAQRSARQIRALGADPGDRIALMVSEPKDFLPLMHGCLLAGFVAVPLYPPPLFGRLDAFGVASSAILSSSGARFLITSDGLKARLAALVAPPIVELCDLSEGADAPVVHQPEPDTLAFLQYTSGSTGVPKGVRVTHRNLMANAKAIMCDGLAASASDRGVTWLPLYHDMGLIGFGLAPLLTATPVTFIATSRFVRNPTLWLKTIHEDAATITFAPNFAYALAARRGPPSDLGSSLDLSSVRMWGCGAEPVSSRALRDFEQRFAFAGVRPGQVSPCYGLAEATLAVTFTPPSAGRKEETLDADAFQCQRVARRVSDAEEGLRYVSCGRALPEHEVRIVNDAGTSLPDGQLGELLVRGPSVCTGYQSRPDVSLPFPSAGLRTGDIGYLRDGELFVTGRLKDAIIVNGRNYDPRAIEEAATAVPGVRLAVAVNVPTDAGDLLSVLVEPSGVVDATLTQQVGKSVAAALGIVPDQVLLLARRALPRTTSGKLRRSAAVELAKAALVAGRSEL